MKKFCFLLVFASLCSNFSQASVLVELQGGAGFGQADGGRFSLEKAGGNLAFGFTIAKIVTLGLDLGASNSFVQIDGKRLIYADADVFIKVRLPLFMFAPYLKAKGGVTGGFGTAPMTAGFGGNVAGYAGTELMFGDHFALTLETGYQKHILAEPALQHSVWSSNLGVILRL